MCSFQNGTWECRGDGYLWDADRDGYDPEDIDHPCPQCNTGAYLRQAAEDAASTSFQSQSGGGYSVYRTGADIWTQAVFEARLINRLAADEALKEIGQVVALSPTRDGGAREHVFDYRSLS